MERFSELIRNLSICQIRDLTKITATTWSTNKIIPVSLALIGNSIKKVTFENTTDKSVNSKQNQTTGDLVQELKEDLSHLGEDVSHLASKMDDFKKSSFKIQHALGLSMSVYSLFFSI
jgi:uncharacterized protein YlxW (UPF0749 family)